MAGETRAYGARWRSCQRRGARAASTAALSRRSTSTAIRRGPYLAVPPRAYRRVPPSQIHDIARAGLLLGTRAVGLTSSGILQRGPFGRNQMADERILSTEVG